MKLNFEAPKQPLSLEEVRRKIYDKYEDLPENNRQKIENNKTRGMCGETSLNLFEIIGKELPVKRMRAEHEDANMHIYLVISGNSPDEDIIIDPTANQFINGYQGMFIGTREDLRKLVLNSEIINTKSKDNPQEAFERTWGNTSRSFY